jgi:FkbM family methyltransferase
MKLREIIYLLGIKPKPKTFGYQIVDFHFEEGLDLQYAKWQHPADRNRTLVFDEIKELSRYLKKGDVAIDIGAHTGDSSIPLAVAVGTSGSVLAFEPNPYVFPILEKNASLNKAITNIIPLNFAATEEQGEFECQYGDEGYCNGGLHDGISKWKHGSAFSVVVKGVNVGSLLKESYPHLLGGLKFVKVDTEGHDYKVLRSIEGLLRICKPYIKTEINKHMPHTERREMFRFLHGLGYDIHLVNCDADLKGSLLNDSDHAIKRHFDVFCVNHQTSAANVAHAQ